MSISNTQWHTAEECGKSPAVMESLFYAGMVKRRRTIDADAKTKIVRYRGK